MEQKTNVLKENLDIEIPERECHRKKSKERGYLFFLFFILRAPYPLFYLFMFLLEYICFTML